MCYIEYDPELLLLLPGCCLKGFTRKLPYYPELPVIYVAVNDWQG
jgi:hypothetical protein